MTTEKLTLMGLPAECRSKIIDEVLATEKPRIEIILRDETQELPEDEFESGQGSWETQVEVVVENAPHSLLLVCQRLYQETYPKISISAIYRVPVFCVDQAFVWDHVTQEARELIDELEIIGYSVNISEIPDVDLKHVRIEERGNEAIFFVLSAQCISLKHENLSSDNIVLPETAEKVQSGKFDAEIADQICSLLESPSEYCRSHLSEYTGSEEEPTYSMTFVLKLRMWLTSMDIWLGDIVVDYTARRLVKWVDRKKLHLDEHVLFYHDD